MTGSLDSRSRQGVTALVLLVPGMTPQPLLPRTGGTPFQANDLAISPDGRHVLLSCNLSDGREPGVYLFDMGDGDSARAFYASERNEGAASFRPDGQWVVYMTNGTGRPEIYLRPFLAENPDSAPIHPVTRLGGNRPLWSPDGRELFYRNGDATMAVGVETGPVFKHGKPEVLFRGVYSSSVNDLDVTPWDIDRYGKRFLMIKSMDSGQAESTTLTRTIIVLNWFEELKELVPVE